MVRLPPVAEGAIYYRPVLRSLKLYLATGGPLWTAATLVGVAFTVFGVLSFVLRASVVALLAFLLAASAALVVGSFWTFHRQREAEDRRGGLGDRFEVLIGEGREALDKMVEAQKANPQRLGPWAEQIDEALEYFERGRQLLIEEGRPSLLHDLGKALNSASRDARRKFNDADPETNLEKMELWGEELRSRSIIMMESVLVGLAEVRKLLLA